MLVTSSSDRPKVGSTMGWRAARYKQEAAPRHPCANGKRAAAKVPGGVGSAHVALPASASPSPT